MQGGDTGNNKEVREISVEPPAIIFFDGVCNLCNGLVDFIIKRDNEGHFKFTSLQSQFAANFIEAHDCGLMNVDTVILASEGRLFIKSSAVIKILTRLRWYYGIMHFFWVFPAFIRDKIYDFIAANRYVWFGKKVTCRVPSEEEKSRFLE